MKLLDFKNIISLDQKNQAEKALLLCYYHYKETSEVFFDMKGIQELFSDAGYNTINPSRVKKTVINKNYMRIPNGYKTVMEFVPTKLQELEKEYSQLWTNNEEIDSNSELIDQSKFCQKRGYLDKLIQQINNTYANNCYDATAILMRRLFEILLILSYQNLKIDNEIKTKDGQGYFMLEKIVTNAIGNSTLHLSRIKNRFDDFRKVGNYSAHNITYIATKKDIDDIKLEYRVMLEELYNKAGLF